MRNRRQHTEHRGELTLRVIHPDGSLPLGGVMGILVSYGSALCWIDLEP
ncbi:MAG: hypothetical protein WC625_00570 [Caldisericia bacterium]